MKVEFKDLIKLVDHFSESPLSQLNLKAGDVEVDLQKNISRPLEQEIVEPLSAEPLSVEPRMIHRSTPKQSSPPRSTESITSPIVGTFYRSPAPDSPPFVSEGEKIKKGATIGIIEAMKNMNQLEAEFDMEIVSVLVQNAQLVEFGTVLFEVNHL